MKLNPTKTEAILLTKRRPRAGGKICLGMWTSLGAVGQISGTKDDENLKLLSTDKTLSKQGFRNADKTVPAIRQRFDSNGLDQTTYLQDHYSSDANVCSTHLVLDEYIGLSSIGSSAKQMPASVGECPTRNANHNSSHVPRVGDHTVI